MVAVAAVEAEIPRSNLSKAVHRVFWPMIFLYALGTLAIGVLIPPDAPQFAGCSEKRCTWFSDFSMGNCSLQSPMQSLKSQQPCPS